MQLEYSKRFEESILKNWLENEKPDLEAEIERKQKEYDDESRKYQSINK